MHNAQRLGGASALVALAPCTRGDVWGRVRKAGGWVSAPCPSMAPPNSARPDPLLSALPPERAADPASPAQSFAELAWSLLRNPLRDTPMSPPCLPFLVVSTTSSPPSPRPPYRRPRCARPLLTPESRRRDIKGRALPSGPRLSGRGQRPPAPADESFDALARLHPSNPRFRTAARCTRCDPRTPIERSERKKRKEKNREKGKRRAETRGRRSGARDRGESMREVGSLCWAALCFAALFLSFLSRRVVPFALQRPWHRAGAGEKGAGASRPGRREKGSTSGGPRHLISKGTCTIHVYNALVRYGCTHGTATGTQPQSPPLAPLALPPRRVHRVHPKGFAARF